MQEIEQMPTGENPEDMTGRQVRALEEARVLRNQLNASTSIYPGGLTFLAWHIDNLVKNATDDRYRLAVIGPDGVEVEPIKMKYDKLIPVLEQPDA